MKWDRDKKIIPLLCFSPTWCSLMLERHQVKERIILPATTKSEMLCSQTSPVHGKPAQLCPASMLGVQCPLHHSRTLRVLPAAMTMLSE